MNSTCNTFIGSIITWETTGKGHPSHMVRSKNTDVQKSMDWNEGQVDLIVLLQWKLQQEEIGRY